MPKLPVRASLEAAKNCRADWLVDFTSVQIVEQEIQSGHGSILFRTSLRDSRALYFAAAFTGIGMRTTRGS